MVAKIEFAEFTSPLNLNSDYVRSMWDQRGLRVLVEAMERCEPWAVDRSPSSRDEAEFVISRFSEVINKSTAPSIAAAVTAEPGLVVEFLGCIGSGKSLALFDWLTLRHESIARLLVTEARLGSDDYGAVLVERLCALEKQALLSRVFSPERIALVLELLSEIGLTHDELI